MGLGVVGSALAVLVPTVSARRSRRRPSHMVRVERAELRPVAALKRGHWINHAESWARIDEAGFGSGGRRSALLSSGEIIDLREPMLVATGRFEPHGTSQVAP